jgi:TonB family protein
MGTRILAAFCGLILIFSATPASATEGSCELFLIQEWPQWVLEKNPKLVEALDESPFYEKHLIELEVFYGSKIEQVLQKNFLKYLQRTSVSLAAGDESSSMVLKARRGKLREIFHQIDSADVISVHLYPLQMSESWRPGLALPLAVSGALHASFLAFTLNFADMDVVVEPLHPSLDPPIVRIVPMPSFPSPLPEVSIGQGEGAEAEADGKVASGSEEKSPVESEISAEPEVMPVPEKKPIRSKPKSPPKKEPVAEPKPDPQPEPIAETERSWTGDFNFPALDEVPANAETGSGSATSSEQGRGEGEAQDGAGRGQGHAQGESQGPGQRSSDAVNVDLQGYGRGVFAAVAAKQRYPRMALRRGLEGTATVRIRVNRDGSLASAPQIVSSTNHEILDQEALRMVQAAAPFLTLPAGFQSEVAEFLIPIQFRIAR